MVMDHRERSQPEGDAERSGVRTRKTARSLKQIATCSMVKKFRALCLTGLKAMPVIIATDIRKAPVPKPETLPIIAGVNVLLWKHKANHPNHFIIRINASGRTQDMAAEKPFAARKTFMQRLILVPITVDY